MSFKNFIRPTRYKILVLVIVALIALLVGAWAVGELVGQGLGGSTLFGKSIIVPWATLIFLPIIPLLIRIYEKAYGATVFMKTLSILFLVFYWYCFACLIVFFLFLFKRHQRSAKKRRTVFS